MLARSSATGSTSGACARSGQTRNGCVGKVEFLEMNSLGALAVGALDAHVVPLRAAQRAMQVAKTGFVGTNAGDAGGRHAAAAGALRGKVDATEHLLAMRLGSLQY